MADKPDKIQEFHGPYRFLSNFYSCSVEYEGVVYPSSEHAYCTQKTLNKKERDYINWHRTASTYEGKKHEHVRETRAGEAKLRSREVTLQPNWEVPDQNGIPLKLHIMEAVLRAKYKCNPGLVDKLLDTDTASITEGNQHHDRFFGVCNCKEHNGGGGENHLGHLHEKLRDEYRKERDGTSKCGR